MKTVWRYPPEVHEFVKQWAPKLRDEDLAEACNKELGTHFTASSMKSFRGNYKYYNGKKQWTKEEYWKYQKYYPKGMYEFVRDNSWGVSSRDMAAMVNEKFGTNLTASGMKQFRQRHGIKSGVTGWYQTGRSPGNKGKKQSEYCSPEAIERSRATQFKKGDVPYNYLPIGSIVLNSQGYKLIKVQNEGPQRQRWRFLHRVVWEEHNGPIPDGMIVLFKDSNRLNCDISNLLLVSRAEHTTMNHRHYRFEDPELTEAGLGVIRLRNAIKGE